MKTLRTALESGQLDKARSLLVEQDWDAGELLMGPVGQFLSVDPDQPFEPDLVREIVENDIISAERLLFHIVSNQLYGLLKKALHDAYLYGDDPIPTKNKIGGTSETHLQALCDGFGRRFDVILQYLDEPVSVLEEHELLKAPDSWGPDPPDELPRYDTLIMAVLLRAEPATDQLQRLADRLIDEGYELSRDEQRRYKQQFDD